MQKLILAVIFLLSISLTAQQKKISDRLLAEISNLDETDYVRTLVILNDRVDVVQMDIQFYKDKATIENRTETVISALKQKAAETQKDLLKYLSEKEGEGAVFSFDSFWITNMVMVEATPNVIYEMAIRNEIQMIDLDGELSRDLPVEKSDAPNYTEDTVEPGVRIINAHKLWELGITGEGRIIMGIDTGVDVTHPQITDRWMGNFVPAEQAWFDPAYGTATPNDCDGHGTHTMGTMTGRLAGDTVGVAIDARWIASNSLCGSGAHTSRSVASFEWAMDPDGDSTTINDMPDAITNSWYDPNIGSDCNSIYVDVIAAVEAVGIAVVFSAGNSGPGTQTITTPKNINIDEVTVWATGAIDGALYLGGSNTPIASFSSRGPSSCGGTGSLLIKPEASAPGVSVRSSYPGGGYSHLSGTSMAAPHVSGAVTLLRQFAPALTGKQIKMALYNTAKDLGEIGEDNTYGTGLIDVYEAFLSLGTPDDTPPEPITDLTVIDPTSNSLKVTWTVPVDTSMGGVTAYDIRFSTSPIVDTLDFYNADQITFMGQPNSAGQMDMIEVTDLEFDTDYYFAIRALDVWGNISVLSNIAMGTTYSAPEVSVSPEEITVNLPAGGASTVENLNIANISQDNSTLNYSLSLQNASFPSTENIKLKLIQNIKNTSTESGTKENLKDVYGYSIEGAGGPDNFGYEWIDSDEPNGPSYEWDDISSTGSIASSWIASSSFDARDEGYAGPFDIGFNFKFYGEEYNQVYFGTNGFISFNPVTGNTFTNAAIPNTDFPNSIIAAVWDDLDGSVNGEVYYKQEGNKFIVQYEGWGEYNGSGTYTFQVVLYSSGKMMIYYKNLTGDVNSSTIGIENSSGNDGLGVAYNSNYLKNNFALKFSADPDWLSANNFSGTIYNSNSVDVELSFVSEDFPEGLYTMDVVIESNDPINPSVTVPVSMYIGSAANDWMADVMIYDAGGMRAGGTITFGQNPLATNGIDEELGEFELPPPPPGGFDVRFILPDLTSSYKDFRNSSETDIIWNFDYQAGGEGYPVTVKWNSEQLPAGSFMLQDKLGGLVYNINMKEDTILVVENIGVTGLNIVYEQMMNATVNMSAGWNMFSVPITSDNMSVSELLPDAGSSVYKFNGSYEVVDELMVDEGYWVKMNESHNLVMDGTPADGIVEVFEGWNLFGVHHWSIDVAEISTEPAGIITSAIFGFNGSYFTSDMLMPGASYWLKTSEAGSINLNGSIAKGSANLIELPQISSDWSKIIVSDALGKQAVLYLTDKTSSTFELPPVPPAGVFDVRFSTGTFAEMEGSVSGINIQGAVYPIRIISLGSDLNIKSLNTILKSGEEISVTDENLKNIQITSINVPENFSLSQNYPNPFNPTTQIKFALPVASIVTVKVYNVVGQVVANLADGNFEAGTHTVDFNAAEISSGVYFYTVEATGTNGINFKETKKMMLMK